MKETVGRNFKMYSYYKIKQMTECVDAVGNLGFSLWYKKHTGVEEGKNKPCESFSVKL